LLDHSTILLGSGMGNPDIHDHTNLPIVVARAAGRLKGRRHLRYREGTPLANLHLTLLDDMGVRLDSFVDSTAVPVRSWTGRLCEGGRPCPA
jgi:hypothetical protein